MKGKVIKIINGPTFFSLNLPSTSSHSSPNTLMITDCKSKDPTKKVSLPKDPVHILNIANILVLLYKNLLYFNYVLFPYKLSSEKRCVIPNLGIMDGVLSPDGSTTQF